MFRGIDGGDDFVGSFGVFLSVTDNSINREEKLEAIKQGIRPTHYVVINPHPDSLKDSDCVEIK